MGGSLEAEENKVLRAQLELGQVRQEIDRKIAEKEEEFNNTRKNHARAMESMQASLETEQKAKAEGLRVKKKLEGDINEFEIALDHANKANNEALKSIRRYQGQLREAEVHYEEAARLRQEMSEKASLAERRSNALQGEMEEARALLNSAERGKRQTESELTEARMAVNEMNNVNSRAAADKRRPSRSLRRPRTAPGCPSPPSCIKLETRTLPTRPRLRTDSALCLVFNRPLWPFLFCFHLSFTLSTPSIEKIQKNYKYFQNYLFNAVIEPFDLSSVM